MKCERQEGELQYLSLRQAGIATSDVSPCRSSILT